MSSSHSCCTGDSDTLNKTRMPVPLNGEEEEQRVFAHVGTLYHHDRADAKPGWKQRGTGEVRINVQPGGHSRLVMRTAGVMRLVLNAGLFPELQVRYEEGDRQVSFTCVNAAHADGTAAPAAAEGAAAAPVNGQAAQAPAMGMYAVKFKERQKAVQFRTLLEKHKHPQPQADAVTEAACGNVDAIAQSIF